MKKSAIKLAVVTNENLHHRYFVSELYDHFDVAIIIIPTGIKGEGFLQKISNKKMLMYGKLWFLLKMLSLVYNKIFAHSMAGATRRNENAFFKDHARRFDAIPTEKIARVETVNSAVAIDLIKKNDIDIICFLGGDIAKGAFIGSAKICSLNYHSGLSPFYNGNKTIFHAVKDSRPNFAGGTLMYITERIDGGGILAHYLPEIQDDDTAACLFMKGIKGAVLLYKQFLEYIQENELPAGVIQQKSFRYVRNIDWIITDDIKLRNFETSGGMKSYRREEQVIAYYDLGNHDISEVYKRSLPILLKKS
jgi:folate-dependent phosphoribosylglycinamide formyltransferase PurN